MIVILLVPGCEVRPYAIREDALQVMKRLFSSVNAFAWSPKGASGDDEAIDMI